MATKGKPVNPRKQGRKLVQHAMMKEYHKLIAEIGVAPEYRHGAARQAMLNDDGTLNEEGREWGRKYQVGMRRISAKFAPPPSIKQTSAETETSLQGTYS